MAQRLEKSPHIKKVAGSKPTWLFSVESDGSELHRCRQPVSGHNTRMGASLEGRVYLVFLLYCKLSNRGVFVCGGSRLFQCNVSLSLNISAGTLTHTDTLTHTHIRIHMGQSCKNPKQFRFVQI